MPSRVPSTTRPDDVRQSEANPRKLLLRLMEEGHRAINDRDWSIAHARRAAVARTSGALTGSYGADYLKNLRADWPE